MAHVTGQTANIVPHPFPWNLALIGIVLLATIAYSIARPPKSAQSYAVLAAMVASFVALFVLSPTDILRVAILIIAAIVILVYCMRAIQGSEHEHQQKLNEVSRRGWEAHADVENLVSEYRTKGLAIQRHGLAEDERQRQFAALKTYIEGRYQRDYRLQTLLALREIETSGVSIELLAPFCGGMVLSLNDITKVSMILPDLLRELDGMNTMADKRGSKNKRAMQRFEDFARRIFAVSKDDLKKAEEAVEEAADEIVKPTEPGIDESDDGRL
jgi:ABC-type multidrug transport system fused ATPase/permease subunit